MIGEKIVSRAGEMGISLPEGAQEAFDTYFSMLRQRNETMNLARGIDDEDEACDRHFIDSLTLLKAADFPQGASVIDVGSGAGFPGLVLSIARPDLRITLLDSLGKRVTFLSEVIEALHLSASAVHARCEDAAKQPPLREAFDFAVARAVAGMPVLCEWLSPFIKPGGRMAVLKGPSVEEELAQAENAMREMKLKREKLLTVVPPGRDWDHKVAVLAKTGRVSAKYPRKSGEAARKPL